jgi:hypothetical protein
MILSVHIIIDSLRFFIMFVFLLIASLIINISEYRFTVISVLLWINILNLIEELRIVLIVFLLRLYDGTHLLDFEFFLLWTTPKVIKYSKNTFAIINVLINFIKIIQIIVRSTFRYGCSLWTTHCWISDGIINSILNHGMSELLSCNLRLY